MATLTVILPTTAAVATPVPMDLAAYDRAVVYATGLAGTEKVTLQVGGGESWVAAVDSFGNAAGLTATAPSGVLAGGAVYGFTKPVTVAPVGVFLAPSGSSRT